MLNKIIDSLLTLIVLVACSKIVFYVNLTANDDLTKETLFSTVIYILCCVLAQILAIYSIWFKGK